MKSFAEQKVPGGKLVAVEVEWGRSIKKVKITGDFFLHPEETLPKIEKALEGMRLGASKDEIAGRITKLLAMSNAELIGVTPDAIAEAIKTAVKKRPGE